jgi:hypothetical protein
MSWPGTEALRPVPSSTTCSIMFASVFATPAGIALGWQLSPV